MSASESSAALARPSLKVLTWNLQHQGLLLRMPKIVAVLRRHRPDVALLQEVPPEVVPALSADLAALGLAHVHADLPVYEKGTSKRYGCLLASRSPVDPAPAGWCSETPFPELVVRGQIASPIGAVDVVSVHIPNGSGNGKKKVDALRALVKQLRAAPRGPRIVGGDFNTPKDESSSGEVTYWDGKPGRGPAWREAEASMIQGALDVGLRDAFRTHHGYERRAWSHVRGGKLRRYDHLFVAEVLHVEAIDYDVEALEEGASDHAPLWAVVY